MTFLYFYSLISHFCFTISSVTDYYILNIFSTKIFCNHVIIIKQINLSLFLSFTTINFANIQLIFSLMVINVLNHHKALVRI